MTVIAYLAHFNGINILPFLFAFGNIKEDIILRSFHKHNFIACGIPNRRAVFGKRAAGNLSVIVIERQYDHHVALIHRSGKRPFHARQIRLFHHIFGCDLRPHDVSVKRTVNSRGKQRFQCRSIGNFLPLDFSDIVVFEIGLHGKLISTAYGNADIVLIHFGSKIVAFIHKIRLRRNK